MTRMATYGMRAGSIAAAAALAMVVVGCTPFSGPLPGHPAPGAYFIQHLEGEGTFTVDVDLGGETRDVYLTFANPRPIDAWGDVTVDGSAAARADEDVPGAVPLASVLPPVKRAPTPEAITAYNQNPFARGRSAPSLRLLESRPAPLLDVEGSKDGNVFFNYDLTSVDATCRKVVTDVTIAGGGKRTLNIWVEDACWDGLKATRVTQTMVDALADRFLLAGGGTFDDIYDWATAMLGAEWGPTGSSDLISADDEITILLCDIANDDSPEGGIVGYFWSKDNYTADYEPHSSERIMFTIDAVMYANGDGAWDPTDYWPEEIYATLAHEFQHMIHFYQRGVLRGAVSARDVWINEMASQVVEDLLSSDDKLNVMGPRGVDGADGSAGSAGNTDGRLPLFNARNDRSLSDWNYDLPSYSITYAFGAWLARNYGGAALLNRLMKCTSTGPDSIEDIVSQATGRTEHFARLLQRWGVAQLLSDATDAPPGYRYNAGGFFSSSVGGSAYRLGSINLYNYTYGGQVGPYRYDRVTIRLYDPLSTSSALCSAAIPGTGALAWTLHLPAGVIASVLAR
jgi:hypothetical protein